MPASLYATETVVTPSLSPAKPQDYSHLKQYHFQKGNQIAKLGGRPKGKKSYYNVLDAAAPALAKAYVKYAMKGNATLLKDSREVFHPLDSDGDGLRVGQAVIFLGGSDLPRQLCSPSEHPPILDADTPTPSPV